MNEVLRRAMYDAGFTEVDLSVELSVDPKTVRNWMRGQVPHPGSRAALAAALGVDADVLWPRLDATLPGSSKPSDLAAVYPRRSGITRSDWLAFFGSARTEVALLANASDLLLQDAEFVQLLAAKGEAGARVRFALATVQTGSTASVRLLHPLMQAGAVELRVHDDAGMYNSIYISDEQLLVNQRAYGLSDSESPVFHYRRSEHGEMFGTYVSSFELIWSASRECVSPGG
ncbi:multiprotein-bridging factor 1 family protein [Kribbella sp. NPDC058245]|uniref:helix-turn-helix domain-containing protein n=1 Tax=Kribbella sp. NPDC058245 TaxID=3346399 RepID=UPI0036E511CD